jgi:hypothetical protein
MPLKMPTKATDPELTAQWSRVMTYLDKTFQALDRLAEMGGTCKVAAANRWTAADHDRAAGQLQACLEAVEAELNQLELRRRHYPRARRLG